LKLNWYYRSYLISLNQRDQDSYKFPPFRRDRVGKMGGGVVVFVKDHINCKHRPDLQIKWKKNEWLWKFWKRNDLYENFEKGGEEETKSMPHAPVEYTIIHSWNNYWIFSPSHFYCSFGHLICIYMARIHIFVYRSKNIRSQYQQRHQIICHTLLWLTTLLLINFRQELHFLHI
jgi:hypothetical protein